MQHGEFSRRQFLGTSAAVAGAAVMAPSIAPGTAWAQAPIIKRTAADQVTLGKTGIKLSRLGMGTGSDNGRIQAAMGKEGFLQLVQHAYNRGITYIDTCDRYDTFGWIADAIKPLPREKLFVQSKISGQPADTLAEIDRHRKAFNTDYIDSMLVHSAITPDWTEQFKRVMDGIDAAKEKKWIRIKGASCHNLPALRTGNASNFNEVHLVRVNPQGKYIDGPGGRGYNAIETNPVDPVILEIKAMHEKGRGVIGMKIVGNGLFTDSAERDKSIRYAMSCKEIDAIVMGFKSTAEIDDAIERIDRALAEG